MRRRSYILFLVILAAGCGRDDTPQVLGSAPQCPAGQTAAERVRFAVARSGSSAFSEEGYRPVAEYLSRYAGVPVELVIGEQYSDLWEMLERKEAEVALLPPLAYVEASARIPCLSLMATMVARGALWYSGYLLVMKHSDINRISDLKGKRVAFVDRHSASGFLFPSVRMREAGLDPDREVMAYFAGEHIAAIRALLDGKVDAAASFGAAIEAARGMGLDVRSLRILAITGHIPMDAVVARGDLEPALVGRLERAFWSLNGVSEAGAKALQGVQGVDGFVPTQDALYDSVREVVRKAQAMGTGEGR